MKCACGCGTPIQKFNKKWGYPIRFANGHSLRWKKAPSTSVRFWSKVNKHGPKQPHMKTCCWEWTGFKNKKGYGLFGVGGSGNSTGAHRVSYKMAYGEIPEGLDVLHHCDNPACVRPLHLFKGTHALNNRDRDLKGRWVDHWRAA